MVKQIPLQNDMFALVDDEDFERVNQFNWTIASSTYEKSVNVFRNKNRSIELLSHYILGTKSNDNKLGVTHLDKNPLNFQKNNLKIASLSFINQTRHGGRNSSSKYKGVCWNKSANKWNAYIHVENKKIHLGYFEYEDEAAKVYNQASLKYFGEHAYQNLIGQDNSAPTVRVECAIKTQRNKKGIKSTSNYRGVFWRTDVNKWRASIYYQGKRYFIGNYINETEAAKAYDIKAIELLGDKAILNFPDSN